MGRDKASLPFGDETLLERTVRVLRGVVDEVVVVAREGQPLDDHGLTIVRDAAEGLGPLAGLTAGLAGMAADRAFLAACDAPFLMPAFVRRVFELCGDRAAAVPFVDGYHMTTAAVYAKGVLPVARQLLEERRLRPLFLIQQVDARIVTEDELRSADPELASLRNCNTPEAYEQALKDAGLYTPPAHEPD